MLTVYLAGPEVFLHEGRELINRKRELARQFGFDADLHGEFSATGAGQELAQDISRRNEALMDRADVCVANLTPFRGVSADPGTVYEVGYMIASKKPVFAYSGDPRPYADRVRAHLGALTVDENRLLTADRELVENHGWSDNLMMEGGIQSRGWTFVRADQATSDPLRDLDTFRRCLAAARDSLS